MLEFLKYPHFTHNKYYYWYVNIINNALIRVNHLGFYEKHHILPKCLGGDQTVKLTFKEHFICHRLLTKFTAGSDKAKMIFSLQTFFHFDRNRKLNNTSRKNEFFKQEYINACILRSTGKNNANYNDELIKLVDIKTNFIIEDTRYNLVCNLGISHQNLHHLIRKAGKFRTHSGYAIWDKNKNCFSHQIPKKVNKTMSKLNVQCEYCKKSTNIGNYARWHGKKCKSFA